MKINDTRSTFEGIPIRSLVPGIVYEEYCNGDSTGEFYSIDYSNDYIVRLNDIKLWHISDALTWSNRTYVKVEVELVVK